MKPFFAAVVFLSGAIAAAAEPARFPTLTNDEAWAKLAPKSKEKPALPGWARMLAGPLPKTTAKMLELEHLHRAESPLGAALSAKLRWVAADALKSPVGVSTAEYDLARAGVIAKGAKFKRPEKEPADEAATLDFARKLSRAAYTITDDEFAEVLRIHGPEKITAIIHTVAYANFHNRILLGIGVPADDPPVAPVAAAGEGDVATPARPPWDDVNAAKGEGPAVKVEWTRDGFDDLTRNLEKQKNRKLRIPLPEASRFEGLPAREKDQAGKILWNTVSSGYQPLLTRKWFACLGAYYEESKVNRVFTNSMFWVVTRTNDCFY
jgi:hypothetical protein